MLRFLTRGQHYSRRGLPFAYAVGKPARAAALPLLCVIAVSCSSPDHSPPASLAPGSMEGTQPVVTDRAAREAASLPRQELASLADSAWRQRQRRDSLEEAIALWERLARLQPDSAETWTRLAHAYFLLADGYLTLAGETDRIAAAFDRGAAAGARALLTSSPRVAARLAAGEPFERVLDVVPPEAAPALFWYASNLDRLAVWEGVTPLLLYADQTRAMMQHLVDDHEEAFHAGPHRYFGTFYAEAPAFAGGDLVRSREHFERAIELDGDYFANKVAYAAHYAVKTEDRALFVRLLEEVLAGDPAADPALLPEQQIEQEKARRLLAHADEMF